MKKTFAVLTAIALSSGILRAQYSAYVPLEQEIVVTPTYVFQTYDDFWMGKKRTSLGQRQQQHTGYLVTEYGLFQDVALDLTVGYTSTSFSKGHPEGDDDSGLTDTTAGVRWRFLDETRAACPWAPTLTLRAGAIIEGTYDDSFPFSAGDGASGAEGSLLFGRAICPNFGLYGDIGYRWRNHDVPEDIFGSAGIYATVRGFSAAVGYRHVQGLSGLDIGGTGFTESKFPETREINQLIEASVGYTDGANRYYSVFGAKSLDGRNTGDKSILGASVSFRF